MTHLADLRNALLTANEESLHGLSFDLKDLDKEIGFLKKWLGDRGSDSPPVDAVAKALDQFIAEPKVKDRRQALLLCHGCTVRIGKSGYRLIEDTSRFSKLLATLDAFEKKPRLLRPFYRGLLNAYFEYDFGAAKPDGRMQWELLRAYLQKKLPRISAEGMQPTWVDLLADNEQLLGDDPGGHYGAVVLRGASEQFDHVRETFAIGDETWLIRQVVLGQIVAATRMADDAFRGSIAKLLSLLVKHQLVVDAGLRCLLDRYQSCRSPAENVALRDVAIAQWSNPWLDANTAKWSLVRPDTKAMVAGWLKLDLIRKFFSLLAADGVNDARRVKFWERYHESIHDMYFALGRDAYSSKGADHVRIRSQMKGRLIELESLSPSNNAFIMCIKDYVMVEFGVKGNACYIFNRNNLPFDLKCSEISDNQYGLKDQRFRERLIHNDKGSERWEVKFARTIHELTSVRPSNPPQAAAEVARSTQPVSTPATGSAPNSAPIVQKPPSAAQLEMLDTSRRIQGPSPKFAMSDLKSFCTSYRLQIEDLRSKNGCLWVRANEHNSRVNGQLQAWGFRFKSGKGWYWE